MYRGKAAPFINILYLAVAKSNKATFAFSRGLPTSYAMLNRTVFPPGNASGHLWERSRAEPSRVEIGFGAPPFAETWNSALSVPGVKMMEPSSLQTPPRGFEASQTVSAAPPASGTFLSKPFAKYAIHFPSGEKKGSDAPSVPSIG